MMINAIIIEDDPMVLQIDKNYLTTNKNIQLVNTFSNGEDALIFLKKNSNIQLALVDCFVPKLDGLSFLKKIRELNIKTEVIMITAANDCESIKKATQLGAIDYLIKPFEFKRFQEAITFFLKKLDILKEENPINQKKIDYLFNKASFKETHEIKYEKGINPKTLDSIINIFRNNPNKKIKSDEISCNLNLSSVTIRRYLNYLVKNDELEFEIDYETGGRPCNKYFLI